MKTFEICSINISQAKGEQKTPVKTARLVPGHGIEGDAHAGNWHRQVSLLAQEDVDTMKGKGIDIGYGDFAENITTKGIDLIALPIDAKIRIGDAELTVTQKGKECHHGCAIFAAVGDCVMPRRGIFVIVEKGGEISVESTGYYDI